MCDKKAPLDKDAEIQRKDAEIQRLNARILDLERIIKEMQIQLNHKGIRKNSSNSSLPPSTDLARKNSSLREKTGRKQGGQPGHEGNTLTMTKAPNETHELIPEYCNGCGNELTAIEAILENKRQVVEIPPVAPIYIEFQSYSKTCSCGHKQIGDYPLGVTNHIQYGASIEAIIAYQSVYQYTPFKRLQGLFIHCFHLPISQGSINNILKRLSAKAGPIYDAIKNQIENSRQVGSDETGVKINGKKGWVWTWQNIFATFISPSLNRSKDTIQKIFPNGFINAILNSDRWKPHLNTFAKGHQLCLAHLLRDLKYLIESEKHTWAESVRQLLLKALELKKQCAQYARDNPQVKEIENGMDVLLAQPLHKGQTPDTLNFQESMIKYREYIFTFLYYAEVPADNNGSERAIRNIKVKQKISGQFKTGQESFCILRSVIDTCIKNKVDVFEALKLIAQMPQPSPVNL